MYIVYGANMCTLSVSHVSYSLIVFQKRKKKKKIIVEAGIYSRFFLIFVVLGDSVY